MMGYLETQWDEVKALPENVGYLRVAYRQGIMKFPHEELILCDIRTPGAIVAHSIQLEGDHPACANGQAICEANHEIHLDGDRTRPMRASGAEDF